ncbi:hypothetical protein LEMLEM_LOCUS12555 [Lemmus lemmus]
MYIHSTRPFSIPVHTFHIVSIAWLLFFPVSNGLCMFSSLALAAELNPLVTGHGNMEERQESCCIALACLELGDECT